MKDERAYPPNLEAEIVGALEGLGENLEVCLVDIKVYPHWNGPRGPVTREYFIELRIRDENLDQTIPEKEDL
jgi:hypothetical protein